MPPSTCQMPRCLTRPETSRRRTRTGSMLCPTAWSRRMASCGLEGRKGALARLYCAVTLGRDNTAQRPDRPLVYTRFHVRDYRRWLDAAIAVARVTHPEDRRFLFVNAWNAWNQGLFLEPDRQSGFSRLNETTRALLNIPSGKPMPKVSVIVPNYNHEPFLRRRLDSIYGQTYKNIEVILLDDCSSDQSRALLDRIRRGLPPDHSHALQREELGQRLSPVGQGHQGGHGRVGVDRRKRRLLRRAISRGSRPVLRRRGGLARLFEMRLRRQEPSCPWGTSFRSM